MPLGGTTFQQCVVGSEPNAIPLCGGPQHEDVQACRDVRISVKNTFIEVGQQSPPPLKRSVTVANVSAGSSSDRTPPVSDQLWLPLNLSNALDEQEVQATPSMGMLDRSPMDAYFDPGRAQSPVSRWFGEGESHRRAPESPLARWLQGSPQVQGRGSSRAEEVCHADALQGPFAMGPEWSVPGQACFVPFGQPMMWQTAPIVPAAMCSPAPNAQTTVQPRVVLVPQQVMPQQAMPQQARPQQLITECSSGVMEGMVAWKAAQSAADRESKGKETYYGTSNQNSVRPRGRNAISKKPADKSDSVGPRAVFVDLSKLVPIV